MLPWLICAAVSALALVLLLRLYLLQKSLDDITGQLGERLGSDTNNLLFLSTRDPHARKLAAELNVHLRELRRQRQRYEEVHEHLDQKRAVDHARIAAELAQDAVARRRV